VAGKGLVLGYAVQRMLTRTYKNLIPDSHLHRKLESLLRRSGGELSVEEICTEILLLPRVEAGLACALVVELTAADPRLRFSSQNRVEWMEPSPEEVWQQRKHFLVLDLETTDGVGRAQRIIELGVCRLAGGGIGNEWATLLNPQQPISPWIRKLTGITETMLATAPRFEDVAERLLEELEDAILVAHHARFDVAVLNGELSRWLGKRLNNRYLCTVELARHFLPGMENYRLETLSRALALHHDRPHRAGSDARATAELFQRLAETSDQHFAAYLRPRPANRNRQRQHS